MKIKIILKNIKLSVQKTRLIANLIRGHRIKDILKILTFNLKKSSKIIKQVLKSVIYNAINNFNLNINYLKLKSINIQKGIYLKRLMPRAKGKSDKINKNFSNIYIIINNIKNGTKN